MAWPAYWNAAPGSDIQTDHLVDDIETAGKERYYAAFGGNMAPIESGFTPGNHHTPGDDVQDLSTYYNAQDRTRGWRAFFVDPTVGYSGTGKPANQGLWGFTDADFAAASTININGFDATYPRRVVDPTSDITFGDGDAPADGDKALGDDGMVYQWDAGLAQWNLLGTCGPHEPDTNTVQRDLATDGDYIVSTLFNQIRLAADVLIWTTNAIAPNTRLEQYGDGDSGYGPGTGTFSTYAAVTADIDATFGLNVGVGSGATIVAWSHIRKAEPVGGPVWSGSSYTTRSQFFTEVTDTVFAYTAEFYFFSQAPVFGSVSTVNLHIFGANGTPAIDTDWALGDTQGPSTADKISILIGMDPTIPQIPGHAPSGTFVVGVDTENDFGFVSDLGQQTAILKWNVAGGFTMI